LELVALALCSYTTVPLLFFSAKVAIVLAVIRLAESIITPSKSVVGVTVTAVALVIDCGNDPDTDTLPLDTPPTDTLTVPVVLPLTV
jgi:hypothetical protein